MSYGSNIRIIIAAQMAKIPPDISKNIPVIKELI